MMRRVSETALLGNRVHDDVEVSGGAHMRATRRPRARPELWCILCRSRNSSSQVRFIYRKYITIKR